jgi:hypothetical protein
MYGKKEKSFAGNSFCEIVFSIFLFSHRENAYWLVRIVSRTTWKSAEARGKTRGLLYGPAATGMLVPQQTVLLLLRVDRKQRFVHQKLSRGILFVNSFFVFSLLAQRERVLVGVDSWSNNMEISRSTLQDLCFVVWTCCNRDSDLTANCV